MPDENGRFKGIALNDVPWKQEFHVDDVVRCVYTGREGLVTHVDGSNINVIPFTCCGGGDAWTATPAELRPV